MSVSIFHRIEVEILHTYKQPGDKKLQLRKLEQNHAWETVDSIIQKLFS